MIDLDLLDQQLEQALTDDVRALRGLTPRSHWHTPPPPEPAGRDEEPAPWEPDDEWPPVPPVAYTDDTEEDDAADGPPEPLLATEQPEIDFEYELEPEPAPEPPVAPVRKLTEVSAPPAQEREARAEQVRARPDSPFAAHAAMGWEKPESAEPPYATSTGRRRPSGPTRLTTTAPPRPTADPRDAVRARLRVAAAMVAASEPPESLYDSKPLQTPAWQLR